MAKVNSRRGQVHGNGEGRRSGGDKCDTMADDDWSHCTDKTGTELQRPRSGGSSVKRPKGPGGAVETR